MDIAMRRFLIFVTLLFLAVSSYGQDGGAIKFLGIPVDGRKSDMVSALQKKGFEYDKENDALNGVFNGRRSIVHVSTNHGVVDRIYVGDADTSDESSIRVEFNNFVYQFANNGKYFCLEDFTIPSGEKIRYEMMVNHKVYQAEFYLWSDIPGSIMKKLASLSDRDDGMADQEVAVLLQEAMQYVKGCVWFVIREFYGAFFISIYYDNLVNRPHGEDL